MRAMIVSVAFVLMMGAAFALTMPAAAEKTFEVMGDFHLEDGMYHPHFEYHGVEEPVLEVTAGEKVTIVFENKGNATCDPMDSTTICYHTFTVAGVSGADTGQVDPGQTKTITFTAPSAARDYQIFCLPHSADGMVATLRVKAVPMDYTLILIALVVIAAVAALAVVMMRRGKKKAP